MFTDAQARFSAAVPRHQPVSAPWWHPEANPLRDIQEFMRGQEAKMAASILGDFMILGPEPLRCPVCHMTRERCLQIWGRDDYVHNQAILDALRWQAPGA